VLLRNRLVTDRISRSIYHVHDVSASGFGRGRSSFRTHRSSNPRSSRRPRGRQGHASPSCGRTGIRWSRVAPLCQGMRSQRNTAHRADHRRRRDGLRNTPVFRVTELRPASRRLPLEVVRDAQPPPIGLRRAALSDTGLRLTCVRRKSSRDRGRTTFHIRRGGYASHRETPFSDNNPRRHSGQASERLSCRGVCLSESRHAHSSHIQHADPVPPPSNPFPSSGFARDRPGASKGGLHGLELESFGS
jgi:hypothetical protein